MYTLAGLLFEEPSRRNCVRVCACNVERKEGGGEERENVEKERERGGGGSTFLACNYVGILTVEESFLDRFGYALNATTLK